MVKGYPIPHLPPNALHRTESVVRRSRFIASTAHASNAAAARGFVQRVCCEFPDAAHNCWAYVAGPPAETAHIGFSDDGEPHSTAGRPMLQVLLYGGIGEIVCVVTRYFGGIKLGMGGLVRAYHGAVQENLHNLPVQEKIIPAHVHLVLDYAHVSRTHRLLSRFAAHITKEYFDTDAHLYIQLPYHYAKDFAAAVQEHTDGCVIMEWIQSPE